MRLVHPTGVVGTNTTANNYSTGGETMRSRIVALLTVGLLLMLAPAAAADSHAGLVTVVHGIPGATVDVYVNGDLTLEDFEPGTITDPLELPEGSYDIEIFAADADPEADDPVVSGSADLAAGANVSIVAHLDADGNPTLSVFANDTSTIAAGEARITVRHTAAAPAVDVLANGEPAFTDVTNGDEGVADLPAGTIEAAVALAGTTEPVIGPADVTLEEGVNTIVYAIGSAEEGTLDLLIQTISGLHDAPDAVDSGLGGLKAAEQQRAEQMTMLGALGALVLLAAGGVGVRRYATRR